MKYNLPKVPRLLPSSLLERETSFLGKQQLYVFVYYTIAILVGLGFNLIGVSGPQKEFNLVVNSGYILVIIMLFSGYLFRKITLSFALFGIIMVTQIATTMEMINCAHTPDEYHLMLIVGNTVLLAVNILFSLIAYLEYTPYVLGVLSMGTYTACMKITENGALNNFFIIFLVIFAVICVLGSRLVHNMRPLDKENTSLKKDEEEFFDLLGQNKEQVRAYFELARARQDFDKTKALLDMAGEDMRRNVIANVKEYLLMQEAGMLEMETLFPEMSASEREVCLLILQGKPLKDICSILGKKESNITCTRTHIRKKLNLQPSDNLLKALQERVKVKK